MNPMIIIQIIKFISMKVVERNIDYHFFSCLNFLLRLLYFFLLFFLNSFYMFKTSSYHDPSYYLSIPLRILINTPS